MFTHSKKHKTLRQAFAWALSLAMICSNLTSIPVQASTVSGGDAEAVSAGDSSASVLSGDVSDTSKIDVWDFGAEQLDTSVYNNKLTEDIINGWFDAAPGTSGVPLLGFTTADGELVFNDNGKTNNRLRTTNKNLCRHDEKSLTGADGTVYTGYVYSNSGGTEEVNLQVKAYAGDIITVVVGSNGGDSLIKFVAPDGTVEGSQTFLASGAKAQVMTFYPAQTGMYTIYSAAETKEKLVVARIYREHTGTVAVTGSVTAPSALSDYSIVFTNTSNGGETVAAVSNGTYSASLNASYTYDVSLKDANGYVITSEASLALAKDATAKTFDVTVESVALSTVTGSVTGLSEEALASLKLSFKSDEIYVPEVTMNGATYTVQLENGVEYTVVAEGVNDYNLTSAAKVSYTASASADVTFEEKTKYAVTIVPEGATAADLANATFTFTNLNEEGYVYTFTGTEGITLRDGTYDVKVRNAGVFVQKLTSNVVVNGAAVSKTIGFDSDITSWTFTDASFAEAAASGEWNGLKFSNASNNKNTYLLSKAGTVSVPVKGACQIKASVCYEYSFYFAADTEASVGQKTNSTSQIDTFTYDYTGEAGYVDITVLGTSYFTKIEIVEATPYAETITVGATGCDYTTINDALDAVRAMDRTDSQRVTIEIQPGNYEEMLVIDVPNVTLKNASSTPSIELKNKGVDIDANAVRITSYYGHGYAYYSMGTDCKWNEEILKVNKENGYLSFENPGTGKTSGSYWNATVVVGASGFEAEGIIFENSFNQYVSAKAADDVIVPLGGAKEPKDAPRASLPEGSTAVQNKAYVERAAALAIMSNCAKVSFDNCKFIGRQDTLYGDAGVTAAFYDCAVYGGTDYIFGPMTAVFAKCDLVFNTSEDKNDVGYITAAQQTSGRGYLMYNCNVTSTTPSVDTASEYTSKPGYFGRPWAANTAEALFYYTVIDAADTNWFESHGASLIQPAGWLNTLSGESALSQEFGTYEMSEHADNQAARAAWSTVMTDDSAVSVEAFLGDWDAFAGKDMTIVVPTNKVDNAPVEEEPEAPVVTNTYVLDTSLDLAAVAQGSKADGDTEKAGTEDYFTMVYGAKSKVDGSNKTFDDGYTATQRFNMGGKTSIGDTTAYAIMFEAANPATVKVWWVSGGDGREMAIFDNAGAVVKKTAETSVKNTLYISELTLDAAGKYFLGSEEGSNYIFKVEVTEEAAASAEPVVNTLDATTDLEAVAQGSKADGDTTVAGSNDYFTLIYSAKTKVDGSNKTFDDGYAATQRINFGGKSSFGDVISNVVKFETNNTATVKVWWVSGGDGREVDIFDNAGTSVVRTAEGSVKNSLYISELSLADAGTYFLGSADGSNYIFKIEVTEEASSAPTEYILDTTTDLEAVAQGAKADGDTQAAGTDDFFTVIYSAKSKVDGSNKTFDDGYAATQRFNMGGKTTFGDTILNAVKFETTNAATVKVWWVSGGDGREIDIFDNAGASVVRTAEGSVKNSLYISELSLAEAGTYFLGSADGSNYIFKIQVTVAGAGGNVKPPRADWSKVEAPVVTGAVAGEKEGTIDVTVSANVGYDGADEVVITMYDAEGNEISSLKSIAEKTEHTRTFTPDASGTYYFGATLSREGETDKVAAEKKSFDFVLPLGTPSVNSATCLGGGKVAISWGAVDEAEKYILTAEGTDKSVETENLSATLEGLTIGQTYTFTVVAVRGEEKSEAGTIEWEVVDAAQRTWSFAAFGQGVNTSNNKASGSVYDNNLVVESMSGKGKLVPASTDGLAFYYTTIDPETENFTLSADVTVEEWTYSNGQEGFGLMAADAVGTHGDSAVFWNNSYMASVTKVEYYWDGSAVADSGTKYSMKLGVGAQEKKGVTAENMESIAGGDLTPFSSNMYTLESSAAKAKLEAGTYNIVGNHTNDAAALGTIASDKTFHLTIQRNNTGYFLTFSEDDGTVTTKKFYHGDDGDELTKIDKDNIYVGFFASRNAKISVTNVELTTINPADDAPAESRPITYIEPNYSMESAKIANQAAYELVFVGNADGKLKIEDANGGIIVENFDVTANVKAKVPTTLNYGENKFKVTFKPNADYKPSKYEELTTYGSVGFNFTVNYEVNDGKVIYVSPNGSWKAPGTKEEPMDIYQAVKKAAPGQYIVLMEGTYNLERTVTVERGISGTADNMIYLIADPEATSRPVLDFNKNCAGMVVAGDYWYMQGFDVTESAPSQKGLQISGDYNVVDQVNAYRNGNTGIQISRYKSTDLYEDWPSNNLILNCTSYLNADPGYEDADGFAAKLTIGDGNVFDGCIAAYNADDGWDLFAKIESGPIGKVVIKNSIAFKNGYDIDANGNEINAGNGNGFKMGGSSISGYHVLENCAAFANKAKGIDSNSCPDIQVINSTSFNNGSYNVAFYTNDAKNTDYSATGIISFKDGKMGTEGENLKPKGTQDNNKIYTATNYYYPDGNTAGVKAAADWFVSLDTDAAIKGGITRFDSSDLTKNATINMNGYLTLTDKAAANAGAVLEGNGTPSPVIELPVISKVTVSENLPAESLTDAVVSATGCDTVEELVTYLRTLITSGDEASAVLPGVTLPNTVVLEVAVQISFDGGLTWELATPENFPEEGVDVTLPYPYGTAGSTHDFVVAHLFTTGAKAGQLEYPAVAKTNDGIKVHITSASPFAIGFKKIEAPVVTPAPSNPKPSNPTPVVPAPVVPAPASPAPAAPGQSTSPKTYDDSVWYEAELMPEKLPVQSVESVADAEEAPVASGAANAVDVPVLIGVDAVDSAVNGEGTLWLVVIAIMGVFGVGLGITAKRYLKREEE